MAAILFNSLCALLLAIWTPLAGLTVSEDSGDGTDDYVHQPGCSSGAAYALLGEHYSEAVLQAAKTLSGASSARVLHEGGLSDLSIVPSRLTITLDQQGRIVELSCN